MLDTSYGSPPPLPLPPPPVAGVKRRSVTHPGVLVAKVRYLDPKSANVHLEQMGTKPAKVGHLAANLLKYASIIPPTHP